jgi:hypothetical protein
MWPSLGTRPDFVFAAGYLGRANASPTTAYNTAQKRVLQYIQNTLNHGILYHANNDEGLIGYSDSN